MTSRQKTPRVERTAAGRRASRGPEDDARRDLRPCVGARRKTDRQRSYRLSAPGPGGLRMTTICDERGGNDFVVKIWRLVPVALGRSDGFATLGVRPGVAPAHGVHELSGSFRQRSFVRRAPAGLDRFRKPLVRHGPESPLTRRGRASAIARAPADGPTLTRRRRRPREPTFHRLARSPAPALAAKSPSERDTAAKTPLDALPCRSHLLGTHRGRVPNAPPEGLAGRRLSCAPRS